MKRKISKIIISFLLTMAMVVGLMSGISLTAYAAPTEELLTTITATGQEQASYSTANVATVSFSYSPYGSSSYIAIWGWWGYGWTATVVPAEGYTITKCVFYDDKDRAATDSEAPFVVETTEEDKTPKVNGVPILANQSKGIKKIEVYGYATPATSYSVTITAGDNMTKTTGSGDAEQTGLTDAMTDVVYTADNGYYFPTDYSVAEVSGIKVTRDSYTQITVSGTPTADAAIALTAPTAKTTPDAPTTAAATDCTTADNNDGMLTGVTTAMEYKKSDAADWTAGTGSDITGLVPGTYYVRVKATDTTNESANQELTIKGFISYTVTFKVVNGKWNEGEGDAATADKTVTLTGHDGDTLKLTADQIPAVGSKPNDTYKAGSWDTTPSADTEITVDTTYTYTYAQKDAISQTVTFKVVNGSWNDETADDKIVTLTGYEGDTLTLSANDIPDVGSKPAEGFKAGSWNTEPIAGTVITQDTTYTYTYEEEDTPVTPGISLSDETVSVKAGESKTVTATTVPEGQTVIWSSANEEVATVTNGAITGVANGTTTVTAKMTYDSTDYTADVTVTVSEDSVSYDVTFKVVNGNWNDGSSDDKKVTLTGAASETLKLSENQIPSVGSDPYEGYKEGAWDVTPSTETAITENTTYIYTYAKGDEPGPGPEEPGVSLDLSDVNVKPGDSVTVTATTVPEGLPVTWSSEDESIATVSGGVITGVAEGTTNILASVEIDGTTYTASVSVTVTKKPAPPKPDDPGKKEEQEENPHTHHYVWETIEATEESDGELRYACNICGAVQTRVPISAYYVFNKNTTEKIRKAGQGATVYVETSRYISFHKMVMEALAERPDVTLEVSFLDEEYKGNRVTVTIPAGTDTLSLVDENGFVGFLYLAVKYGYTFVN
jgi:uncharacterized protein YjdB